MNQARQTGLLEVNQPLSPVIVQHLEDFLSQVVVEETDLSHP